MARRRRRAVHAGPVGPACGPGSLTGSGPVSFNGTGMSGASHTVSTAALLPGGFAQWCPVLEAEPSAPCGWDPCPSRAGAACRVAVSTRRTVASGPWTPRARKQATGRRLTLERRGVPAVRRPTASRASDPASGPQTLQPSVLRACSFPRGTGQGKPDRYAPKPAMRVPRLW